MQKYVVRARALSHVFGDQGVAFGCVQSKQFVSDVEATHGEVRDEDACKQAAAQDRVVSDAFFGSKPMSEYIDSLENIFLQLDSM